MSGRLRREDRKDASFGMPEFAGLTGKSLGKANGGKRTSKMRVSKLKRRSSHATEDSASERSQLAREVEKLKAEQSKMQQMSMTMPMPMHGQPSTNGSSNYPGAAVWAQTSPTAAWPPHMRPNTGTSNVVWSGLASGEQDPEEVLRRFSKKFREKEDKYKAVIGRFSKLNQELVLAKSKFQVHIETLTSELERVNRVSLDKSRSLEKAKIEIQEHIAKRKQMSTKFGDYVKLRERQASVVAERHEKERSTRRTQIAKLLEEINSKSATISEMKEKIQQLTVTEKQAIAAKKDMAKKMGAPDIQSLQQKVGDLEKSGIKLRIENEKLKAMHESMSQSIETVMKEKVSMSDEIERLSKELEARKLEVKEKKKEAVELSQKSEILSSDVAKYKLECTSCQQIVRELREKIISTEEKLEDATVDVEQYKGEARDLQEKLSTLEEANVKEQGSSSYLRAELEELRNEKKGWEAASIKLKTELEKLKAENQQLQEKLKLSADLEKLDLEKLNEVMSTNKRMAGALEVIRNHVKRQTDMPPHESKSSMPAVAST